MQRFSRVVLRFNGTAVATIRALAELGATLAQEETFAVLLKTSVATGKWDVRKGKERILLRSFVVNIPVLSAPASPPGLSCRC
ncbi:MAG: hypothetical protein AAGJ35_15605, partial [Myxococcota bacterium]